jgi:hypothetical protein
MTKFEKNSPVTPFKGPSQIEFARPSINNLQPPFTVFYNEDFF